MKKGKGKIEANQIIKGTIKNKVLLQSQKKYN